MFNLQALFGRHEVYGWRDDYTLVAAATLNEVAARLGDSIDVAVSTASHRDVFLLPDRFLTAVIAPLIRAAADPEVERVMSEANTAPATWRAPLRPLRAVLPSLPRYPRWR